MNEFVSYLDPAVNPSIGVLTFDCSVASVVVYYNKTTLFVEASVITITKAGLVPDLSRTKSWCLDYIHIRKGVGIDANCSDNEYKRITLPMFSNGSEVDLYRSYTNGLKLKHRNGYRTEVCFAIYRHCETLEVGQTFTFLFNR
jgi:hypothetical protein